MNHKLYYSMKGPTSKCLLWIGFISFCLFAAFPAGLLAQIPTHGAAGDGVPKDKKKKKRKAKLPPQDLSPAMVAAARYNFSPSFLQGKADAEPPKPSPSGLRGAAGQSGFTPGGLQSVSLSNPTSLQFGPDKRLYVSQQNGKIKALTIVRNGPNAYVVTATEIINSINRIPNHDDNGNVNTAVTSRQVTGILVKGTAANPVLYVSSSDSRIGGPSGKTALDTNSGIVSALTRNGSTWTKVDLVRGLPRSEENHSVNGMQLDAQTNTLYLAVGGLTNAGSPSVNFNYASEFALSAAILSINLTAINALPIKGSGDTAYKYDLPTLDDPTRPNNPDGTDAGDPFGGDNGLNQAKIVAGGPVQVYSPGYRNPYDLVITQARRMYTISNGANQGWGGYPQNVGTPNVTNNYVLGEPGSTAPSGALGTIDNLDNFHYIGNLDAYTPGSYYGGHPNPTRANPAGAGLYTFNGTAGVFHTAATGANPLPADWPPVPLAQARPIEGSFQMPGGTQNKALLTFISSTNGMAEYTASNFNGSLKGALLACGFNDASIYKIGLTADGTNTTNAKSATNKRNNDLPFSSGLGNQPLDIAIQGDNDVFPGTVWAATYGANAVTVFEPQNSFVCTGKYDGNDDDQDGYTNSDEIDNATNPCSAASIPADYDKDFISDLNDPDDDNDGIADNVDTFALDANNGLATTLPIKYDLFNGNPGTGLFGVGFTGLMVNRDSVYDDLYVNDNIIAGGAVGAFTVVAVSAGDALGALKNQENAFQFGVKPGAGCGAFTVQARMLGPFFNGKPPQNYQSQGIYIGSGDQDNYLKIALNANGGLGGVEVVYEEAGQPVATQFSLPAVPASTLDFFLLVDPGTGTVQPQYSADKGPVISLGPPVRVGGALLNALTGPPALAVGTIATSRGAAPFTATWDYIYVTANQASTNAPPVVATPIPNQNAIAGAVFSYAFPATTFSDPNNDPLAYVANLPNGSGLPAWLKFDGTTRAFSGTPPAAGPTSPATYPIKVTANDGKGGIVSSSYVLNIVPPPTASAGPDQALVLPAGSSAALAGAGTAGAGAAVAAYAWSQASGPNLAAFSSTAVPAPALSGLVAGRYVFRLVVTDNLGQASAPSQVALTVYPAPGAALYRVRAGGAALATALGAFAADQYFAPIPGATFVRPGLAIAGTASPALYQDERYGANGLLGYAFPLPNGQYTVVLHFAEIYWTAAGKRVFDVALENTKVLTAYDICRKVGPFVATTETFPVTVADGVLNVDFSSRNPGGANNPKISAIEVLAAGTSSTAARPALAAAAPLAPLAGPAQVYPTPTLDGSVQVRLAEPVVGPLRYTLASPLGTVLAQGERALAQPTDALDFDFGPRLGPGAYYLLLQAPGANVRLKVLRR